LNESRAVVFKMRDLLRHEAKGLQSAEAARPRKLVRSHGGSHVKREKRNWLHGLFHIIRENSLTLVLFALFAICLFAQGFAGWRLQNETLAAHGRAVIGYWRNLSSGTFLAGLATNWQAAFLQLASLIVFSGFLYQRGAPHSRNPFKAKSRQKQREEAGRFTWLYRHSLFLAFLLLFVLTLALDVAVGTKAYNEERALAGQPLISLAAFLGSAKFWSSIMQTWQAEYLAIAVFVVLSIFLRQQGSAESKPVGSSDKTTGEANQ
jgi:hypothetical protein